MTTKPTMALAELSEKGADVDFVREMIRHMAQRMMDMDVESLCAAAYGERMSPTDEMDPPTGCCGVRRSGGMERWLHSLQVVIQ